MRDPECTRILFQRKQTTPQAGCALRVLRFLASRKTMNLAGRRRLCHPHGFLTCLQMGTCELGGKFQVHNQVWTLKHFTLWITLPHSQVALLLGACHI